MPYCHSKVSTLMALLHAGPDEAPGLLAGACKALVTGHQTVSKGRQEGHDAANNVQVHNAPVHSRIPDC